MKCVLLIPLALGVIAAVMAVPRLAGEAPEREQVEPAIAVVDAPPPPPARLAPAPVPARAIAPAAPPETEAQLLVRMQGLVEENPEAVLGLAEEARFRYPDGEFQEQRAFVEVRALVNLERIGEARVKARTLVERNPNSPYADDVRRLLGIRPRPVR